MRVDITPVGKPRQTQSDKWKQRPVVMRYRTFADELRLNYPQSLPDRLELVFWLPMPKSWSKKKRMGMNHTRHQQKPDIDNLCKAVMDALAEDDSTVWLLKATKYWSTEGAIDITELTS